MGEQRGHRYARVDRQATLWRAWLVILLVAVSGATAIPAIWHVDHGPDQDCAVCKLGHEPVADLADGSQTTPPETAVGIPDILARWVVVATISPAPARGPPPA